MQKLFNLKIFILFFGLLLVGCFDPSVRHHISLNDPAGIDTKFEAKTRSLTLVDQKPFVLFFFDTNCGACKLQIPAIVQLQEKYGNNVKIIGVLGDSAGFDNDIELLKHHGVNFSTTSDPLSVEYFSSAVGGIYGVPATFIFDKTGTLSSKIIGLVPFNALQNKLKQVL